MTHKSEIRKANRKRLNVVLVTYRQAVRWR